MRISPLLPLPFQESIGTLLPMRLVIQRMRRYRLFAPQRVQTLFQAMALPEK